MKISLPFFSGIRPRVAKNQIGQTEAQTAENCKLWDGTLRPWDNYLLEQLLSNTGIVQAIYLYEDNYWFEWEAEIDLIEAPISGDTDGKFFYTGDQVPKKSNRTLATTGSAPYPVEAYPLGLPSPTEALTGTPGGPPNGTGDDRYTTYRWTVVSSWGEESYPSPPSSTVTSKNGERTTTRSKTCIWMRSIFIRSQSRRA